MLTPRNKNEFQNRKFRKIGSELVLKEEMIRKWFFHEGKFMEEGEELVVKTLLLY